MSNITPLNGQNNGQHQQISVTPDDLSFVECECGSTNFLNGHKIGKLSKVHPKNVSGKMQTVAVPVNICAECNSELDPKKLAE